MATDLQQELIASVLASPVLAPLIDRWDRLALPDCWIAAGALAQTVWNRKYGLQPIHGISDVDLIYFDPNDLTEYAETEHMVRIRDAFRQIPVRLDVKNEARVHEWYALKLGYKIEQYRSIHDAVATFLTTATAIAVRPLDGSLCVEAPFGIGDLMNGIVRPNKKQVTREIYQAKAERWIGIWPGLTVIPW